MPVCEVFVPQLYCTPVRALDPPAESPLEPPAGGAGDRRAPPRSRLGTRVRRSAHAQATRERLDHHQQQRGSWHEPGSRYYGSGREIEGVEGGGHLCTAQGEVRVCSAGPAARAIAIPAPLSSAGALAVRGGGTAPGGVTARLSV